MNSVASIIQKTILTLAIAAVIMWFSRTGPGIHSLRAN